MSVSSVSASGLNGKKTRKLSTAGGIVPFASTGSPVVTQATQGGSTRTILTFTATGSVTVTAQYPVRAEWLVIAGGGGGGYAGGGGGGVLRGFENLTAGTAYTVTVGAGGAGSTNIQSVLGSDGTASVFNTNTANKGGGGCSVNSGTGNGGTGYGSSGGMFRNATPTAAEVKGTQTQGFKSGVGNNLGSGDCGSGGGGGGAVGGDSVSGSNNIGGAGGAGYLTDLIGTATYYAGGGGGGASGGTLNQGGAAGVGGGGAGVPGTPGGAGTANTGGGGGGSYGGGTGIGGAGGSGVVIIALYS